MRIAIPRTTHAPRRARIGAALAIPALLVLAGFAAGPVAAADHDSYVTVFGDSSGKTVSVGTDAVIAVVLQANGGTGYEWRATEEPSLSVIGAPADVGWPYTVSDTELLGSPVSWVWYFPASAPGTTSFAAGLYPPGSETAEETFTLGIVVRTGDGAEAVLTEPDCGQIVGIESSGVVGITLDSNVTTGYSWSVTTAPDSILAAEPGSGDYAAPPADSPIGAGGSQHFAWRASAAGATSLELAYIQAGSTTPGKTCGLTVVAGAPVLPPEKLALVTETPGATPPPTSTDAPPTVTASTAALVVALLAGILALPALAIRRRRVA